MVDRQQVLELLDRLGAESDDTVLQAARALHRLVGEAGARWDDLLHRDLAASSLASPPAPVEDDRDEPIAEILTGGVGEPALSDADKNESARLIDRLLTLATLSDTLREDLVTLKRAIVEGEFEIMDARYVRALAKRLGA